MHATSRRVAAIGLLIVGLSAWFAPARAGVLAESISVSGDSISRGFNANTSSCNYGDNVSRNWATGDNHGASYCQAGAGGVFSHAERLECNAADDVVVFNNAVSGGDMLNDFASQSAGMRANLSSVAGPRYALVLMGHNDACTNTLSRTGNGCGGDHNPNNYCRTTNAAFEREFREGMDQLVQVPSLRLAVLATVRVSELCNFRTKNGCGPTLGLNCSSIWGTAGFLEDVFGAGGVCASLTSDCSDQRRIDMYDTLVGYNEILSRVSDEYAAIPTGGVSATGAVKAADVHVRYGDGSFYAKLGSSDISCCDCFHPSDQGHAKLAEFAWNGMQCSPANPCCTDTGNPLADARCDVEDTTSFYPGGYWPNDIACPNGLLEPEEHCDDGNALDGDCCSSICTYEPAGAPCPGDGNACTYDVCTATGACTHPASFDSCDDGNACTLTDRCQGGACVGSDPVACTALGPCREAGACDPQTGLCSSPPVADGTPCDDGNACTQLDTCQGGECAGSQPIVCSASDACHVAGVCNPLSGACSNPAKSNGSACDDGNACTQVDSCQSGACSGANPVVCAALDQCHVAGTCSPATGLCSNPARADGNVCDDADACTQIDTCQAGACSGANPLVCAALDQCHSAGVCSPLTGLCSNPPKADGSSCDDGNACTVADQCSGGACAGGGETCGDGAVQAQCNEACDDGAGNGVDGCCSQTCTVIDADDDGSCDRDDPCTGPVAVRRAKLVVDGLHTAAADDSLQLAGELAVPFPFDPPLDPALNGLRVIVSDANAVVLDVYVPGGLEWRVNSSGSKWKYSNRDSDRPGGISRVLLRKSSLGPGALKFSLRGKSGEYPAGINALPLSATVVFDPPSAVTGQCGLATFTGAPPAASCKAASNGRRITCR